MYSVIVLTFLLLLFPLLSRVARRGTVAAGLAREQPLCSLGGWLLHFTEEVIQFPLLTSFRLSLTPLCV